MTQQPAIDYLDRDRQRAWAVEAVHLGGLTLIAAIMDLIGLLPACLQEPKLSDRIGGAISIVATIGFWLGMTALEWKHRHRRERRLHARWYSIGAQSLLVACAFSVAAHDHPHPWGTACLTATLAVGAALGWHAWIRRNALSPERQAELDRMIAEYESAMVPVVIERHETSQFEAAAAAYRLPAAPVRGVFPILPVDWKITGRHEPKVYFIIHGNRIKIGTTVEIRKRVRALSLRMDNVALLLPGGADIERRYHEQFKHLRIGDTEWFTDAPELVNFIAVRQPQE